MFKGLFSRDNYYCGTEIALDYKPKNSADDPLVKGLGDNSIVV